MPENEPTLTWTQLRDDLRHHAFASGETDQVGLEIELTLAAADPVSGHYDVNATLEAIARTWAALPGHPWEHVRPFADGRITLEPGGQLEYSGPPYEAADQAARAGLQASLQLCQLAQSQGAACLLAIGFHPWTETAALGLHTDRPRYRGMQRHFDRHGRSGRRMMRLTGSVQVNVDYGLDGPQERTQRWELAQRLAPILTATFANGSVEGGRPVANQASLRAETWLNLDPTRTGFPQGFLDNPDSDPIEQYLHFALQAESFLIPSYGADPDQADVPLDSPAIRFGDWLAGHHPELGYPTLDDWHDHLTTLFPEVRPRGFLEIRSIDAPGMAWMAVPVLVTSMALQNPSVRQPLLELLRPWHGQLTSLRRRAAILGLADPTLAHLSEAVFDHVLPHLSGEAEATVRSYAERYIQARQSPGHEFAATLGQGTHPWIDLPQLIDLENRRFDALPQHCLSAGVC